MWTGALNSKEPVDSCVAGSVVGSCKEGMGPGREGWAAYLVFAGYFESPVIFVRGMQSRSERHCQSYLLTRYDVVELQEASWRRNNMGSADHDGDRCLQLIPRIQRRVNFDIAEAVVLLRYLVCHFRGY